MKKCKVGDAVDLEEWDIVSSPRCATCMVHSGYEASAVNDTFNSLKGFFSAIRIAITDIQASALPPIGIL